MKKITIRDITIEFEETLDLEITEEKIVVRGKTPTSYPVYIPTYPLQPTYPTNPWITWTLPNYVPNTGVQYQSSLELQNYQGRSSLDNGYLGCYQSQDCNQDASYQNQQTTFPYSF